jgi:FkbM family methyltransferase
MGISNRTGLISAYYSRTRNFPISFLQVVRHGLLERTCEQIGPEYVQAIVDRGSLEEVRIRDLADPLYWPKQIPHHELYKSCADCLCPMHWHHYEVPETSVEGGETVVDCGAAEGIFALSVARRASKLAIFEPWNGFHESLKATFGNGALIRGQALGKLSRTAYLSGDTLYGSISESGDTPVSVSSMDDFRREFGPINFIKADIEGSEHDLLEGAKETILADRPKIAITVYHIGNDWEHMLKQVRSVVPDYRFRIKGLSYNGGKARPVMLHMWT